MHHLSHAPAPTRHAAPRHESDPPLILFATGSTGGHVTPALAIAEAISDAGWPARMLFCGPAGGVAERMVAVAGGAFVALEIHPIRGAGPRRLARGLTELPIGAVRSARLLQSLRPDLVVGTGAHTSGPLLGVAALRGIPTLLFEANVEVGLANRWLGPLVRGAAVAWPQTLGSFAGQDFVSGWPVRRAMRESASRRGRDAERLALLILGGSAGASVLDRAVCDALPYLGSLAGRLSVVHQASREEVARVREQYAMAGVDALVESFFPNIAEQLERASLVITRAGAATLAELAAAGLPAIVVPGAAAGDHQMANAKAWEAGGCARALLPHELNGETMAAAILGLAQDRPARERMGHAAKAHHRSDAAARLAEWCRLAVQTR